MKASLKKLPWWHPKREPAVYIGFILSVVGELATLLETHPRWQDFVVAAVPVVTGAIVRQFVTPATTA